MIIKKIKQSKLINPDLETYISIMNYGRSIFLINQIFLIFSDFLTQKYTMYRYLNIGQNSIKKILDWSIQFLIY